jgi:hypothetical protein
MLQVLLFALIAYILYNLIFRFILPVYRATRQIKKGFRDMQDKMNGAMGVQDPFGQQQPRQPDPAPKKGDYIDFEEIK